MGHKTTTLTPVQKRALTMLRNSGISVSLNVSVAPSAPAERTYASKAERAAGNGFTCTCGRVDLRVAPVAGRSFHKDPAGNLHDLR